MASRTIEQIQAAIINSINQIPELATIAANNSKRAIWRLFTFVQATAILTLEQLIDVFKLETEVIIASGTPATPSWIADKINKFQYSTTNPQIVQLINLVPTYPTVDTSLLLITRVGVTTTVSNKVQIKVAKSEPPVALLAPELSALQGYINTIGIAGIDYLVTSTNADQIYIDADIYYNGQYSAVIQANVISAINTLLSTLPFNGNFKVSDLEVAIRSIVGVTDVVLNNVTIRTDAQTIAQGAKLIQNNTIISRFYPTVAGYIISETTSGSTLTDSLLFVAS